MVVALYCIIIIASIGIMGILFILRRRIRAKIIQMVIRGQNMKYASVVKFIKSYINSKSFDAALEAVIGVQINKERLDIYEKLLIYCPELNEKSKEYINDRISKNKDLLKKREKMIEGLGMLLEAEKKQQPNRNLENWLENIENYRDPHSSLSTIFNEQANAYANRIEAQILYGNVTADASVYTGTASSLSAAVPENRPPVEEIGINRSHHIPPVTVTRSGFYSIESDQQAMMARQEAELQAARLEQEMDMGDRRRIAEYSNHITLGNIRVPPGGVYSVALSRGRIASLNDRGMLLSING
jgi:hypothetical protein